MNTVQYNKLCYATLKLIAIRRQTEEEEEDVLLLLLRSRRQTD